MDKQRRFGIFAALAAALLFGAAAPLGKPLLTFLTDLQLAGLLYLGAALGVLLILMRERPLILPWRMPNGMPETSGSDLVWRRSWAGVTAGWAADCCGSLRFTLA